MRQEESYQGTLLWGLCSDHKMHNDHEEESSGVVDSYVLACTATFLHSICKKIFFLVGLACTTVAAIQLSFGYNLSNHG